MWISHAIGQIGPYVNSSYSNPFKSWAGIIGPGRLPSPCPCLYTPQQYRHPQRRLRSRMSERRRIPDFKKHIWNSRNARGETFCDILEKGKMRVIDPRNKEQENDYNGRKESPVQSAITNTVNNYSGNRIWKMKWLGQLLLHSIDDSHFQIDAWY